MNGWVHMNIGWNIETFINLTGIIISTIGAIHILKVNWRQYGVLFLLSGAVGQILCYIFVAIGFYSFPVRLFPWLFPMPFFLVLTLFPFYVLLGVRYSPKPWIWKIPFYWTIIHIGMFGEIAAQYFTDVISYEKFWNSWDSYTWWWLFLLIFEWVGGMIVSPEYRKPLDEEILRYGRLGWFIIHFILIATIFLGGFYVGRVTLN
jgi:hypothetical protein